ncbi:MAG: major paralogous domain-containing protein [Candidatus Electronema aureum]|uniref:Major paralogous domain-containing protein n=1 Tax=Candidatus Electronema aureum TaxID=2005002 RepID=A0A521G461_9BACT|nr:MAG: major paralogous domain-containing protein [Candidatus Electronema aureum]
MKKFVLILAASIASFSCLQGKASGNSSLLFDIPAIVSKAPRMSGTFTLADNVIDVGKNSVSNIVDISKTATGEMQIRLSGAIADSLQVGKILYIPPDIDSRFPIGFSGKVISYVVNADETKTIVLGELSFAESIKEGRSDISNIALDTSNFVGIITPSAVQFTSPALEKVSNSSKGNFYVLRDEYVQKQELLLKMAEQQNVIVTPDPISLDAKIELGSMGVDASRMSPVAGSSSVGFDVSGSFDKIKYTEDYEINGLKLNRLNLRLDGELDFDVKFNGKGSVTFGYFSRAWNEVEDQAFDLKISSGKIIGLSLEDKQGKYPLAGLVFSVKCPPEKPCLSYLGQTQTPVRNAKELGVIVWISLVLKGEYSIDGDLSLAHLNPANLSLGIKKTDNKFEIIKSLQRVASSGRLLEAPVFNGEFNAKATAGIAADIDFFALNIRVASAGMNLVAQSSFSAKGTASYGTDSLDAPWSWQTDACFTRGIGAGAVFGGAVNFGINFDDSSWIKSDIDPLSYSFHIPKDEEMELPGWHGAWYYAKLTDTCDVPTVTSPTGRVWMDRNLGASRVATSYNDGQAYGDSYQWGRLADGHQKRTGGYTYQRSTTDVPGHDQFICMSNNSTDWNWRVPQNGNLWQGVNGINNPCPTGFRLPTADEWQAEMDTWISRDEIGAFASPLKLSRTTAVHPACVRIGESHEYWSSTVKDAVSALFSTFDGSIIFGSRAGGTSVRCIKD